MRVNAERVRGRMAELGLTSEDLAARLGVAEATVRAWMKGINRPQVRLWGQLERILGPGVIEERRS